MLVLAGPTVGGLVPPHWAAPDDNAFHQLGWTNLTSLWEAKDRAPSRTNASSAYYPPITSIVRFGGVAPGGALVSDTWFYIPSETEWGAFATVTSANHTMSPPPLKDPGLAYDPVDRYLLLFGGSLSNGSAYGGTWVFKGGDWANLTWAPLSFGSKPSPDPATHPLLAYDPQVGAVVLLDPSHGGATWTFASGTWTRLAAPPPPYPSGTGATAFDWSLGDLLLVAGAGTSAGGSPGTSYSAWRFHSGNWSTEPTTNAPTGGTMGGMVWDDLLQEALLTFTSPSFAVWTLNGTHWTMDPSGTGAEVPPRTGASLQYDPWGQFLLVWGGDSGSGSSLPDVWGWDAPPLGTPGPSTPGPAPIPPIFQGAAVGLIGAPLALLAYLYLRPRRPSPERSSAPSPAPA